jgi:uncharacterized membrane protein YjdF
MRYLSIQDDVWDSQKDAGIAFFGVALAVLFYGLSLNDFNINELRN